MMADLWTNRTEIGTNLKKKITIGLSKSYLGWLLIILLILIIIYVMVRYLEWVNTKNSQQNTINRESFKSFNQVAEYNNTIGNNYSQNGLPRTIINQKKAAINFIQPGDHECSNLQSYIAAKYLIYMNQPNIQARGFDTLSDLNSKYQQGICQEITLDEQAITSKWIHQEIAKLEDHNFRTIANKWISASWLCKAQPWLEGGMPHTHDRMIIMKPEWFKQIKPTTIDIGILWHEITHIWQRLAPQDFTSLYHSWGFREIPVNNIPKGLDPILVRSRLNPDALPNNLWVWFPPQTHNNSQLAISSSDTGYWIGAVFPTVSPQSLHEIEFQAYPLTAGGNVYLGQQPTDLNNFKPFADFFGSGRNHYHPNELAAHFMDELLTSRLNTQYPGCQIFKEWLSRQS